MPGLMKIRPAAQPMILELQSVDTKHNPVLTILAHRTWDSEAKKFAHEQKQRVITIVDEGPLQLERLKSK